METSVSQPCSSASGMRYSSLRVLLPPNARPLGGGITNHNFTVRVGEGTFVLRIGGRDTDLLGIDRHTEAAAARMAADIGVGPKVSG